MVKNLQIDYGVTIIEAGKELFSIGKRRGLMVPTGILERVQGGGNR